MYSWRGDPNLSGSSDRDYLGQLILHLTEEISRSSSTANNYFLRGNAFLDSGDFSGAVRDYSAALELDPDNSVYHNNLGIALRYMERFDEAIGAYDRAIDWTLITGMPTRTGVSPTPTKATWRWLSRISTGQ